MSVLSVFADAFFAALIFGVFIIYAAMAFAAMNLRWFEDRSYREVSLFIFAGFMGLSLIFASIVATVTAAASQ